jgi:O-antigen ligase
MMTASRVVGQLGLDRSFPTSRLWFVTLCVLTVGAGWAAAQPAGLAVGGLIVAVALTAVWLLRIDDRVLHALTASMFLESLGFGPISIGRSLAIIALLVLLWRLALTGFQPRALTPAIWLPIVGYSAWIVASGFWAADSAGWTFAMGQLGLALSFFAAFAFMIQSVDQVVALLRTFAAGAALAGFLGIAQGLLGQRAAGLQGDPNLYAVYQVAAIPAALTLARQSRSARRWWAAALVPLVGSVVASGSRAGFIATVVVLLILLARGELRTTQVRKPHPAVTTLTALVLLVAASLVTATYPRFNPARIATDRGSGRLDIWYVAWQQFLHHPVLGIGGGNFKPISVHLLGTVPGVQLIKSHLLLISGIEVHNLYLETLTEYGLIGAALYLSLLLGAVFTARSVERRFSRSPVTVLIPMFAVFAVTSIFLSVANSKLLWMLLAFTAALQAVPARPGSRSVWRVQRTGGGPTAGLQLGSAPLIERATTSGP